MEKRISSNQPSAAGSPKRTKFINTYRVLEPIELSAFGNLYISPTNGNVLKLTSEDYDREHQPGFIRTFQNVCPLNAAVLTYMTPQEFGKLKTKLAAKRYANHPLNKQRSTIEKKAFQPRCVCKRWGWPRTVNLRTPSRCPRLWFGDLASGFDTGLIVIGGDNAAAYGSAHKAMDLLLP